MRTRHHYIPIVEARPGMVLGAATRVIVRRMLSLELPSGHVLTEENLHQLNTHHAEFIFVDLSDSRSDQQVALDAALAARRVMQIFDGADLTDPNMATLFDQVLGYRSA
ncbi:MAG: hypothetical protein ACOYNF_06585 [Rhodoferax sp.]